MAEVKSALRIFLKNEAGAMQSDLTLFLGESIELALFVTGVASYGAPVAANCNFCPGAAAQSAGYPEFRLVT